MVESAADIGRFWDAVVGGRVDEHRRPPFAVAQYPDCRLPEAAQILFGRMDVICLQQTVL